MPEIKPSEPATAWASTRFAPHLQPLAAFVADLLCELFKFKLSQLEPGSRWMVELGWDWCSLEPSELIIEMEQRLQVSIPDEVVEGCSSIEDFVVRVHDHLANPPCVLPVGGDFSGPLSDA